MGNDVDKKPTQTTVRPPNHLEPTLDPSPLPISAHPNPAVRTAPSRLKLRCRVGERRLKYATHPFMHNTNKGRLREAREMTTGHSNGRYSAHRQLLAHYIRRVPIQSRVPAVLRFMLCALHDNAQLSLCTRRRTSMLGQSYVESVPQEWFWSHADFRSPVSWVFWDPRGG
jgi:hypothetical protein